MKIKVFSLFLSVLTLSVGLKAATSSTSKKELKEVKKEERTVHGVIYSENNVAAAHAIDGASGENQVGISIKTSDSSNVQFRYVFNSQYKDNKTTVGDFQIRFNESKLATINNTNVWSNFRLYLPTSDASSFIGRYQARSYFGFTQKISKIISINYFTSPRLYLYSIDELGQTSSSFLHMIDANFSANKYIKGITRLGYVNSYSNSGTKAEQHITQQSWKTADYNSDVVIVNIGFAVSLPGGISLETYAEQVHDVRKNATAYSLLKKEETSYYLNFSISI